MTTKHSPLSVLKAQADQIAAILKATEPAPGKESVKAGIVMDDKLITIELRWETVRDISEAGLSEYIVRQMREARDVAN